jgi:hypothetical protein
MTVPQSVPETQRQATRATEYSSQGSGAPPSDTPPDNRASALEAQLTNGTRLKTALHRLVLVLPLTLIIFVEALRHQEENVKLPLLELDIKIASVIPIFMMLICYMLYRAMRYCRIVIWTVLILPEQINSVTQIVLDNTEAYKIKSAYYEEVLDPMVADVVAELQNSKSNLVRALSSNALPMLNWIKSFVVYCFIFLVLTFMLFYVSQELFYATTSLKIDGFKFRWLSEPTAAIDVLLLGLSSLLLLFSWLNATSVAVAVAGIAFFAVVSSYFVILLASKLRLLGFLKSLATLTPSARNKMSEALFHAAWSKLFSRNADAVRLSESAFELAPNLETVHAKARERHSLNEFDSLFFEIGRSESPETSAASVVTHSWARFVSRLPKARSGDTKSSTVELPSGSWEGVFIYKNGRTWGRMSANIASAKALLSGNGSDKYGAFTISGVISYDTEEVMFNKQYVGRHPVRYRGFLLEGALSGRCRLGSFNSLVQGSFVMWPAF